MVHVYGPHVFHTDNEELELHVKQFGGPSARTSSAPRASTGGKVYSLPINLHTINQFFDAQLQPRRGAALPRCLDASHGTIRTTSRIRHSRPSAAISTRRSCGPTPRKQWGLHPARVPASMLKRLPLRFDYNDNAFAHKYQGIPKDGYTKAVGYMLDDPNVRIELGTKFRRANADRFDHVFYSGPIDGWFDYAHGYLPYRTLDFERIRADGDLQGCAVLNSCDYGHNWTRSTEHKHFTPWEEHKQTIVYREMPREARRYDIPFYPIRYAGPNEMLDKYETLAAHEDKMTFVL
jgi:UDP-galactopyranose mutase